ncbi:MAG: condensation domain-containing protein [Geitlerinemataceae cyanobacterium]
MDNLGIFPLFENIDLHLKLRGKPVTSDALPEFPQVSPSDKNRSPAPSGDFWKTIRSRIKSQRQAPPLQPISSDEPIPLSFAQEHLWQLAQFGAGSSVYNIANAIHLRFALNIPALEQSLREICRRHTILRTTFPTVDGQTVQVVAPDNPLQLPIIDLSTLPAHQQRPKAQQVAIGNAQQPFDLDREPGFRVTLLRLGNAEHILLLTAHHMVFDGWSYGIFFQELSTLYQAFSCGNPSPLKELPVQYADYAHWQRQWLQGEVLDEQLNYWKQQLGSNLSPLALPIDFPRPPIPSYRGASHSFKLSADLTTALKALSQEESATPFATLLAAFSALLHRYTGQQNILLCSPVASRNSPQIKESIGYFNNLVLLRTALEGNPTFRELVRRARKVVLGAYEHQDAPFQKLTELPEVARIPLSRGSIAFQNYQAPKVELSGTVARNFDIGNAAAESSAAESSAAAKTTPTAELPPETSTPSESPETSDFDLSLTLYNREATITGVLRYKTDLFEATTITQMAENFQNLLEMLVSEPDRSLSDLPAFESTHAANLRELEAELTGHPNVQESLILQKDDGVGNTHRVAYVVPTQEEVPSLEDLRQFLQGKFPEDLLPSGFVPLEALPLTPDGQVDRFALPLPTFLQQSPRQAYVAPETELQKQLVEIWQKILWLEEDIGIDDNFFALGGHSLLAVRLVAEIERVLETQLPLTALSQLSTIAELAKIIEGKTESPTPPPPPKIDPLSPQLDPNIYHQQLAFTAGWKGQRVAPNALMVGLNTEGTKLPLFWCLQGFRELSQLAKYIGEDQPIYGMRSGHLVMDYTRANIQGLAAHYVSEILTVDAKGPYLIGGNCQGGKIAFEIAQQLQNRGKIVTLLCWLERVCPPQPYSGRIALFYGRDSEYNPYKRFRHPEAGWRKFYTGECSVDVVAGGHGQYFNEPNIQDLAETLRVRIEKARSQPVLPALLWPDWVYRAQLSAPQAISAGVEETVSVTVRVQNRSPLTWQSTVKSGIRVGNHWLNDLAEVVKWSDGYVDLPEDLPPKGEVELELVVTTPDEPGRYQLELDVVEEGMTWFQDKGSQTVRVAVEVSEKPSSAIGHEIDRPQFEGNRDTLTTLHKIGNVASPILGSVGNDTSQPNPIQVQPPDSQTYQHLGHVRFDKGDTEGAIAYYQKAIALNPQQSVEVYQNLGNAFSQQGDPNAGIAAYQQAIRLQSDNPHLYFQLGQVQYQQQDFAAAIASYRKAWELAPDLIWISKNLGEALIKSDQIEEAIVVYQKACEVQPDNSDLYAQLANLHRRQGDLEAAIATYQISIDLTPDNADLHKAIGDVWLQNEQLEAARSSYQQALKLDPDNPHFYLAVGNLQKREGNLEGAIAACQKAIELAPELFSGHNNLGDIFNQQQRFNEAISCYKTALKLKPDNPNLALKAGNIERQRGNIEEATTHYQQAIELNPNLFGAQKNLGDLFHQQTQFEEAIACYQIALELQPEHPGVNLALGNTHFRQKNFEGAIVHYQKLLKLVPKPKQPFGIYKNLGDALAERERPEDAIASYEKALQFQPNNPAVKRSLKALRLKLAKH